jgi:peptidoglycan hydrolase FlgJ
MRNADFRMGDFPALPGSAGGTASTGAVRMASASSAVTGGADTPRFGALYQQLQREVTRYIEQGEGGAWLSPEGAWHRQQLQGAFSSGTEASRTSGAAATASGADAASAASPAQQQAFVEQVLPLAREAAGRLGVSPEVLTAQAALETGWGRAPIRRADGASTHNFFGIKAGGSWTGEVAMAATTEVEDGTAVARQAAFRAYASPAQSFQDLASLISSSQRYQGALGTGADARAYGQALQRGGYATDPAYADKLARVAARIQGGTP